MPVRAIPELHMMGVLALRLVRESASAPLIIVHLTVIAMAYVNRELNFSASSPKEIYKFA
jgi:hypothetical protein